MQTCPGFFLKSLLESPGNLLEMCSVKFVDTLYIVSTVMCAVNVNGA